MGQRLTLQASIAVRVPYSFPFLEMLLSACHQSHIYIGYDNIGNVCWQLAVLRVGVHRIALAKVCLSPPLSSSLGWHFCFLSSQNRKKLLFKSPSEGFNYLYTILICQHRPSIRKVIVRAGRTKYHSRGRASPATLLQGGVK